MGVGRDNMGVGRIIWGCEGWADKLWVKECGSGVVGRWQSGRKCEIYID